MIDEQAVAAETDEVVTPPAEESSAQDLDALLNEFESGVNEPEDEGQGEQPDEVKSAVEYVKSIQEKEARQATDASINDAVNSIKNELTQPLPDRAVKGIIYEMAETNPAFVRAFQQRKQNPSAWAKVLKAVASDINKDFSDTPNPDLTDDRKKLASAVRSATSEASKSERKEYGRMSDAELENEKRQLSRASR